MSCRLRLPGQMIKIQPMKSFLKCNQTMITFKCSSLPAMYRSRLIEINNQKYISLQPISGFNSLFLSSLEDIVCKHKLHTLRCYQVSRFHYLPLCKAGPSRSRSWSPRRRSDGTSRPTGANFKLKEIHTVPPTVVIPLLFWLLFMSLPKQ